MSGKFLINACLALALAGCEGSESNATTDSSSTGSEAAASVRSAMEIKPGEWEITEEMVNIEAPNMPPDVAAAIKRNMGEKTTSRRCITPAEATGGDFVTPDTDAHCTKQGFSFAGGQVQGTMICSTDEGKATMSMSGRHSGTSFDISSKVTSANEGGSVTMNSRVTGRRVGECTEASD